MFDTYELAKNPDGTPKTETIRRKLSELEVAFVEDRGNRINFGDPRMLSHNFQVFGEGFDPLLVQRMIVVFDTCNPDPVEVELVLYVKA